MKKLSSIHKGSRVRENETPTTQLPMQAFSASQPKGLFNRPSAKPTQLNKGAAEAPHTRPVGDMRRGIHTANRKQP
jgi:hypothetical protein